MNPQFDLDALIDATDFGDISLDFSTTTTTTTQQAPQQVIQAASPQQPKKQTKNTGVKRTSNGAVKQQLPQHASPAAMQAAAAHFAAVAQQNMHKGFVGMMPPHAGHAPMMFPPNMHHMPFAPHMQFAQAQMVPPFMPPMAGHQPFPFGMPQAAARHLVPPQQTPQFSVVPNIKAMTDVTAKMPKESV